jgi:hypothetical protein
MSKLQELMKQFEDVFSVLTKEEINETYKKYKSMYKEDMFLKISEVINEDDTPLARGCNYGPEFTMLVAEFFNLPFEDDDRNLALSWVIESAIYDAFFDQYESGGKFILDENPVKSTEEKLCEFF